MREGLYSTKLQHSRRSLLSESESDVGSLLSGLSQARKVPDRRKLPQKDNGKVGLRSRPKASSNGISNRRQQKNETYKKEESKIIKLQAFARGYIVRFAYQSRLTMEKTKRNFFAIQLQAYIRGFLQRQRYQSITGKKRDHRKVPAQKASAARTGLGSPQHSRARSRGQRRNEPKSDVVVGAVPMVISNLPTGRQSAMTSSDQLDESQSEAGSLMSNLSRLSQARKVPDRRRNREARDAKVLISNPPSGRRSSINTADQMDDSQSEVGSVMSNLSRLSQARKVPDRRKKQEIKGTKILISIPATARRSSMNTADQMDDSQSDVGSVMSNLSRLSQARRVPDRRKKQERKEAKILISNPPAFDQMDDSQSEAGSVVSNLSRLSQARKVPDRRQKQEVIGARILISNPPTGRRSSINTADQMDDSQSDVGSVMSNLSRLSQARKVPDRRKKQERKEGRFLIANPPTGRRSSMNTADQMDDSQSDVGSVMSNLSRLSQARRVPDRRKKQEMKEAKVLISNPPTFDQMDESQSEVGSVVSNLSRLSQARKVPDRRKKQEAIGGRILISNPPTSDQMDESQSDAGSVMSNLSRLSQARKVPDRRKKQEAKEGKASDRNKRDARCANAVKIQALARGYIQRFLFRSMLAMQNTKKKYAAIILQAYVRGFIQRKNGPEVSRIHVTPKREPLPATNPPSGRTDPRDKRRKSRNTNSNSQSHRRPKEKTHLSTPHKMLKKPVRHLSNSDGGDRMPPRQLTIRKPRRQRSDLGEENHEVPVKHLTIRKPRRRQSHDDDGPPRRVIVGGSNRPRTKGRSQSNTDFSPPRKVMLRVKKGKRVEIEMDKSEESLDQKGRADRHASQNNASESRLGESESDVGSLMSGLSQARKVPDRRLKQQAPGRPNSKGDEKINSEKQIARTESATKIQAAGRGYIARFAYQSKLILEQTKKKFFAIQIQALARGFLVRSRRST